MEKIDSFSGKYRFLSNFYKCEIPYEGEIYLSVENAYQAAKTENKSLRISFLEINAADAKKLGKRLKLRDGWEDMKVDVMRLLLKQKFSNPRNKLGKLLLETADAELIEGNYWGDREWGVYNGEGKNLLGKLLMEIREELKQ